MNLVLWLHKEVVSIWSPQFHRARRYLHKADGRSRASLYGRYDTHQLQIKRHGISPGATLFLGASVLLSVNVLP